MSFSKEAEERLVQNVRSVTALVEADGLHPTDAIVKVAEESGVKPSFLPLICQAYNHGRAVAQRNECDTVLCKMTSYPIAKIEDVMAKLYPEEAEKSAAVVDDCYSRPPVGPRRDDEAQRAKLAAMKIESPTPAPIPRDADADTRRKLASVQAAKQEIETARRNFSNSEIVFRNQLSKVASYFSQPRHYRLSLEEVEFYANGLLGKEASSIMDWVQVDRSLKEKRASDQTQFTHPRKMDEEPFCTIRDAIKAAHEVVECHAKYMASEKSARVTAEKEMGWADKARGFSVLDGTEKSAGNLLGMLLGSAATRGMHKSKMNRSQNEMDITSQLSDPGHLAELRQIEAQATLADLLNNDNVISGYDPYDVTEAYNEIASMSPHAATQPAILRPMLRKRLTGGAVESFEAEQLANIEKTMTETDNINVDQSKSPVLNIQPTSPALNFGALGGS